MMTHLLDLRRRLLWVMAFFLGIFCLFFYFSTTVFQYFVAPLLHFFSNDMGLIATQITAPVFIPLMLAANLALLSTLPVALWHAWRFAAPGLYPHERKNMGWTIIASIVLFLLGALFCFYGILPAMLRLFVSATPPGVRYMPEMASAIDFMTRMMVIFGMCFQVPLICVVLVKTGLIETATLKKIRPYWIVMSFVVGMLLTPPDVLSQIMLAVPLWFLYEISLVVIRLLMRGSD